MLGVESSGATSGCTCQDGSINRQGTAPAFYVSRTGGNRRTRRPVAAYVPQGICRLRPVSNRQVARRLLQRYTGKVCCLRSHRLDKRWTIEGIGKVRVQQRVQCVQYEYIIHDLIPFV